MYLYTFMTVAYVALFILFLVNSFKYFELLEQYNEILVKLRGLSLSCSVNSDYIIECLEKLVDKGDKVDIPEFMKERKE